MLPVLPAHLVELPPPRERFVARADHLDVVGHYTRAERAGDWLPSGAGFTPEGFEATWDAVAAAIAGRR